MRTFAATDATLECSAIAVRLCRERRGRNVLRAESRLQVVGELAHRTWAFEAGDPDRAAVEQLHDEREAPTDALLGVRPSRVAAISGSSSSRTCSASREPPIRLRCWPVSSSRPGWAADPSSVQTTGRETSGRIRKVSGQRGGAVSGETTAMEPILVAVHLLAAAVWVGGTVALVFVAVPPVQRLEGEARGAAAARVRPPLAPDRLERARHRGRHRARPRGVRPRLRHRADVLRLGARGQGSARRAPRRRRLPARLRPRPRPCPPDPGGRAAVAPAAADADRAREPARSRLRLPVLGVVLAELVS